MMYWFRQLTLPAALTLCFGLSPAWATDAPQTPPAGDEVKPLKDAAESPKDAEKNDKARAKKQRKKKRRKKGPEVLPVDDVPGVDKKAPAPTPETETPPEEEGSETPETNEDEWTPDSAQTMVTPKPETPEPTKPADPLHFDKIDLAQFDIPIVDTPEVRKWLTWFTGPGHNIYQRWLDRSPRYQPMMKAALIKAGMPTDLVYLSMIESGYQIKATSHASAGGLWQFMPATGKRFKLKQTYWVDERYDPEKAVGAAIQYLRFLHKRFESWPLAWAAYNAGEGRMGYAVKTTGEREFFKLAKSKYVPTETKRYVPKIMAAAILGHYPELYGFTPPKPIEVLEYDVSTVADAVELSVIAKCAKTDVATIRDLNPALRRYATPPDGYDMRLPLGVRDEFQAALAKVPANKRITYIRHKVRRGESLGRIAKKYNTTVQAIIRANKVRNANRIYPGMKLTIPRSEAAAAALATNGSPKKSTAKTHSTPKSHTVRKGEVLSKIASKYSLTTAQLKQYNGLKNDRILVGQSLRLSPSAKASKPKASTTVHVVKKGDTLSQIAERYGVRTSELQRLNNIRSASQIHVGQRLKVRTADSDWRTYKVRAGDSLGRIATRNGCTIRDLKSWNKLNSTVIHPGQRLRIRK